MRSAPPDPPDEELIARLRAGPGREAAMARIIARYGERTYAFFRARVGDPVLAADLNQEVYLALLVDIDRFRGDCSLGTWLFRLARFRLSKLRRRWRVHLDEREGVPLEEVARAIRGTAPAPDERLARDERLRRLRTCLARLDERQRAVVLRHYGDGWTLARITRHLQLANPSGARALLLAAQRRLRRCMSGEERR